MWLVNLDPTQGREQAGTRPALVLSVDKFNDGPADLVVILPITSRDKRIASHVQVNPPMGGLGLVSFIKCEEVRCISKRRCIRLLGTVDSKVMAEVGFKVAAILGLP